MKLLQVLNQDLSEIDNGEGYVVRLCEMHSESFDFQKEVTGKGSCQFPDCPEPADVIITIPYEEV